MVWMRVHIPPLYHTNIGQPRNLSVSVADDLKHNSLSATRGRDYIKGFANLVPD